MHTACLPGGRKRLATMKLVRVTRAVLVEKRAQVAARAIQAGRPKAKRTQLKEGEQPRDVHAHARDRQPLHGALSHVFTMARRLGVARAGANPFSGLSKLREDKGRTRSLSDDERKRLLAETAKDPQLHILVTLALATAARAGELVQLTWADVDLKAGSCSGTQRTRSHARRGTRRSVRAAQRLREGAPAPPAGSVSRQGAGRVRLHETIR